MVSGQIDDLQQNLVLKHHEFQERTNVISSLEREFKPLAQQMTRSDHMLSTLQVLVPTQHILATCILL